MLPTSRALTLIVILVAAGAAAPQAPGSGPQDRFDLPDAPVRDGILHLPILGGLTLDLEPYAIRTDDYHSIRWGVLERVTVSGVPLTAYEGSLRDHPGSDARVLVGPSGVTAFMSLGDGRIVAVRPQAFEDADARRGMHRYEVHAGGPAFSHAVDHGAIPVVEDPVPEHPTSTLPATTVRDTRLFIVADDAFVKRHDNLLGYHSILGLSLDRSEEMVTSFALLLDLVYSKQVGARFRVAAIQLWYQPDPFLALTPDGTLYNFRDYYETGGGKDMARPRDVALLLTGFEWQGTQIVGNAFQTSLSTSYAYAVAQATLPTTRTAVIVAHEIGHVFGGTHEKAETAPPTLMAPNVCLCHEFSDGIPNPALDNLKDMQALARQRLGTLTI